MNDIERNSGVEGNYVNKTSKKPFETLYIAIILITVIILGVYIVNSKKEAEKNAQVAKAIIEKYNLDKNKNTTTNNSTSVTTQKTIIPEQNSTKIETKKTDIKPVLQDVNLRSDSTSASDKIHIIYEGDVVEILDYKVNSEGYLWYKVKHNNRIGWISYVGFEKKEGVITNNNSYGITPIKYGGNENLSSNNLKTFTSNSSFVRQVWYRPSDESMFVQLKDNYYQYCNVEEYMYKNFQTAYSHGEYYNIHFRGSSRYSCERHTQNITNNESQSFECFYKLFDDGESRIACYSDDKNLFMGSYKENSYDAGLEVRFTCSGFLGMDFDSLYNASSSSYFDSTVRWKTECSDFNESVGMQFNSMIDKLTPNVWCKQGKDYSRPFFGCYNPDNEILIDVYNNETKKYCNVSEYSWDSYRKHHTTPLLTCN